MDVSNTAKPFANRFFEMAAQGSLFELYDQMLGELDVHKVLEKTTSVVKEVFDSERATIFRVFSETMELESFAIIGNIARKIRVPISEDSLAGFCALSEKAFVLPDAYGDLTSLHSSLKFDRSWDKLNHFRTRDVMCSPVIFKGELLGVIQVINSRNEIFQEANISLLESVSRFVAYALHHTQVYEELSSLKYLEREKAEFMRIIVEGFKLPLAASKSIVAGLQQANTKNTALLFGLDKLEKNTNNLSQLVNDIHHLSQVKCGCPLSETSVFDLRIDSGIVFNNFQDKASLNNLQLVFESSDTTINIRMDRQAFHLILSNLLSNSVKYTEDGVVKLILQSSDSWAVITLQDTGMGIPEDEISGIFKEFFRASNARQSGIEGTGVGLVIVKELVERYKGEMEIKSILNKGTQFILRLPLFFPPDINS